MSYLYNIFFLIKLYLFCQNNVVVSLLYAIWSSKRVTLQQSVNLPFFPDRRYFNQPYVQVLETLTENCPTWV